MVSTRVLLEGPRIEPLLEQVRNSYGVGARIVSAEKVRTGGLGGFFARQRYEVAIEVDAPTAAADQKGGAGMASKYDMASTDNMASTADPAGQAQPASLAALLELVEASQDRFRSLWRDRSSRPPR